MDLSEAFSRLASHDSTLYSGDAKVRVVSQGSLSKSTNYHRKRPYPYQNPPTENKYYFSCHFYVDHLIDML